MSVFLTLVGPGHRMGPAPVLPKKEQLRLSVRSVRSVRSVEERGDDCNNYRIRMGATSADGRRTDEEVKEWAQWFSTEHGPALCRKHGALGFSIQEMDMSGNRLGNEALEAALAAVLGYAQRIVSIKFHRNKLSRGAGIQQLLRRGVTHQVHLSHNLLPDIEMAALVHVAVGASCAEGKPLYPLRATSPLWLRMEHNPGHGGPLTTAAIRSGGSRVCHANVHTGWCTPFSCWSHLRPPAVHLTYLDTQGADQGAARDTPRARVRGAAAWGAPCTKAPEQQIRKAPEEAGCAENGAPPSPAAAEEKNEKLPKSVSAWLDCGRRALLSDDQEVWPAVVLAVAESALSLAIPPPPHRPPPPPPPARGKPPKEAEAEPTGWTRPLVR